MPEVVVVAYYGEDRSRVYQLLPWLPVLDELDRAWPVAVVVRDPAVAQHVASTTRLPVHLAGSLERLTEEYGELAAKVVLYCNNSPTNFDSLITSGMLHVHVNHGESDKASMASNNAKAYDRVFVAGDAAVRRLATSLLELDVSRLVPIGRPQLDLPTADAVAASERPTVLYAPTWEGDAAYNNYSSLDLHGVAIVSAALSLSGVRVVYKPHPQIRTSTTPEIRAAHAQVCSLLAGDDHLVVLGGDVAGVLPVCDLIVTDVSAIGLDWLYLRPDRPLVLVDRHDDPRALVDAAPVARCSDVVGAVDMPQLASLLAARLGEDPHHDERLAVRRHYFGDLAPGQSLPRFVAAVADVVAQRDTALAALSSL